MQMTIEELGFLSNKQGRKNMESTLKKKLTLIMGIFFACLCAVFLLTSCGQDEAEDKNNFVVGVDQANPPYCFSDNEGNLTGFDVDLAKEVAKRNGWNVEIRPIEWDAKDNLLNSGTIDCIWAAFTQEGREGLYAFTDPYMLNKQVLVVRSDSSITKPSDLAGKKVVTQIDSAALHSLQSEKNKKLLDSFGQLQQLQDYTNSFLNLETGAADAVAGDLTVALYQEAAKPGEFRILEPSLSDEHLSIGFKLGKEQEAEKVSKALHEMYDDGTVAEIANKYKTYGLDINNCCLGEENQEDPAKAAAAGTAGEDNAQPADSNKGQNQERAKMGVPAMIALLGKGFLITLEIFFVTLIGSLPLGVLVALGRMSKFKPLAKLMQLCISILRGTPLMLQLLAIFFGPYYLFHVQLTPSWQIMACMIAFIVNSTAYFAEIYRSGIQSISKGQYEAAEVLGYTKQQTFIRIVLPQVVKRILPAMGNEVITMAKDTSLAFVIGVCELMSVSKTTSAAQVSMEPFLWAALMYWMLCLVVEFVLGRTEKKLGYYHDQD